MTQVETAKPIKRRKQSQLAMVWHRFKKSKTALLGLAVLTVFVVLAVFAGAFASPESVKQTDKKSLFVSPSWGRGPHIFGTDEFGRDVFARVIYGSRVSLTIGIVSTAIAAVIGGLLGAAAGYYGKAVDSLIMRFMDVISSIPQILLAMAVVAALGANMTNLLIALTVSSIATYARLVRSTVVTLTEQEFVEAARACGSSDLRIIVKHVIPNSLSPIICQMAFSSSRMILTAASMSYLGLGIQPPNPEWGAMLASAKTYMWTYPYLITIPGVCIVLAALSITLIGDGLRDALDPRLKD
jgi:peptide/nickel transport system permease protein